MPAWEWLYYAAFACILSWQGLSWTTIESIIFLQVDILKILLQGLFIILIALSLVLQKRTFGEILIGVLLGSVFLASALVCKDRDLLFAFVLVFAGKGVSFRCLARVTFAVSCALIVLTVLFALSGTIEIRYAINTDSRELRSAWGFTHPNRFAFVIFLACFSWLALRFPRFDAKDLVILIPAFLIICFFIQSRTSALILLVLIIGVYGYKAVYGKNVARTIGVVILITGSVLIALSLFFMVNYDASNSLHSVINKMMSGRLSLANEYYTRFPPSLLGTSFENVAIRNSSFESRLVVDNAYARLVILYGILPSALWVGSFVVLCIKGIKRNTVSIAFVFYGIMIILGFSESMTLAFSSNIALLALSDLFPGSAVELQSRDCRESLE